MWNNERLKLSLQNLFQEPSNVFTTSIISQATLQYQKLMSLWESLSFTQATFLVVSITCWCLMIAMSLLGLFVARRRYGKPKRSVSSQFNPETAPGVSIIRPLKGVDCNLLENLASSFRQDYPVFEIIFSVANENDPAIEVAEKLMKRYPKVDARLIIAERDVGENPKINNLITPYERAKYDVLWIKDSNIWVDPGCLSRSVEKLQLPGVGLVHHLPFATSPDTFGSELEMLFLDTVHAKMYLAINFLGPDSCVVGKSNIYRKSDVESVGGLAQFGKYMAEDNLIARALWRKGLKHEMTSDLAYQPLGSMATPDYFLRRSRWARIRKYTVTTATIIEPLTESILCGLLASYGFYTLWQIHPLNFLACHLIAWFMIDLSIFQTLSGKTLEVENLRGFIMAWTLREITALPLYIYSVVGDTVDWRDGTFRLLADSTVVRIPTQPQNNQRRLSFASLRIAANVNSTRNSNLKPWVVSIITSIILIIDIFMDVLFKSQRNGNPVECTDSDMLKVASRENLRRRKSQQRRRRIMRGESDEQNDIDNEPIGSENSADEREIDDPIIHAANRYLRNSLSRTRNYFFGISYDDEFEKEITDDPKSDTLESPSLHNKKKESPSHRRSVSLSNDSSSSSLNNLSRKTGATHTRHHSLLNEIFWGVSIGLSMHLQNEKNAIEGRRKRRYTSSSGADCSTNNTDERTRPRSLSIDL